jgi:predicted PurR-regulated permease PerM
MSLSTDHADQQEFSQPGAATLLISIILTCVLLFLFQKIIWLVAPAMLALMIYYCVRPLVENLASRGVRHETAATFVWFLLQLIAIAAVASVALILTDVRRWQQVSQRYFHGAQALLHNSINSLEVTVPALKNAGLSAQVDGQIHEFVGHFSEKYLLAIALQLMKWLPSLLLIPYFIYFLLKDASRLKKYIIRSIPNSFFEEALLLVHRLDASLQNYFHGLLLLTLLDTLCLALGLAGLGMTKPLTLGAVTAVLAWIPYVGSTIGCAVVVAIAAADFPDKTWMAYACLALFLSVRLLDDFVFLPATIGRKLNVHPLLSVLMLFLGANVAGAIGLILALPLLGIVTVTDDAISQVILGRIRKARRRAAKSSVALVSASGASCDLATTDRVSSTPR